MPRFSLPDVRQIAVISEAQPRGEFRSYLEPVFELMNEESDRFQVSFYTVNDLNAEELRRYHAVVLDGLQNNTRLYLPKRSWRWFKMAAVPC
jgi:hypothetical protein